MTQHTQQEIDEALNQPPPRQGIGVRVLKAVGLNSQNVKRCELKFSTDGAVLSIDLVLGPEVLARVGEAMQ
jgi:hypothetical protein